MADLSEAQIDEKIVLLRGLLKDAGGIDARLKEMRRLHDATEEIALGLAKIIQNTGQQTVDNYGEKLKEAMYEALRNIKDFLEKYLDKQLAALDDQFSERLSDWMGFATVMMEDLVKEGYVDASVLPRMQNVVFQMAATKATAVARGESLREAAERLLTGLDIKPD